MAHRLAKHRHIPANPCQSVSISPAFAAVSVLCMRRPACSPLDFYRCFAQVPTPSTGRCRYASPRCRSGAATPCCRCTRANGFNHSLIFDRRNADMVVPEPFRRLPVQDLRQPRNAPFPNAPTPRIVHAQTTAETPGSAPCWPAPRPLLSRPLLYLPLLPGVPLPGLSL